ncbi:MAG TPA: hypothetical protein VGL57_10870 [Solirubrobacteraceae bacterium]|jgi:hypothetical protein
MIHLSPRRALGPLLGVALLGLSVGPALAQGAGGRHEPVAHHAKKKKSKKKSGTQVTVRCASVAVTCKGTTGPQGPSGPIGPVGPAGAPGATVVLRARGTAATLAAAPGSCGEIFCGGSIAVTPDLWTEGAEEDDQLIGTLTATIPSTAECGYEESSTPHTDEVILTVLVDGKLDGIAELEGGSSESTVTAPIAFDLGIEAAEAAQEGFGTGFLMSNGTSQTHVLTVQGSDRCTTVHHATISSLAIDVLGTS